MTLDFLQSQQSAPHLDFTKEPKIFHMWVTLTGCLSSSENCIEVRGVHLFAVVDPLVHFIGQIRSDVYITPGLIANPSWKLPPINFMLLGVGTARAREMEKCIF